MSYAQARLDCVKKRLKRISQVSLTSRTIAKKIALFTADKKAEDILVLDMRKVVNFCDYFVICSGNTVRQAKAIADGIYEGLDKLGIQAQHKHGTKDATWIVFDVGDIVVHIFEKQAREFYNLEHLWQEAKEVSF